MKKHPFPKDERGMALVVAIVTVLGLAGLALAASFSTVLEKTVTTTEKQSSAALYAADSGVEAVRQFVTNYTETKLDSLTEAWGGVGMVIPDPNKFFPTNGITVARTTAAPKFSALTTFVFEDSTQTGDSQIYTYRYTTTSNGQANGSARRVVSEGTLRVSATRGSFTDYLMFTDVHLNQSGGPVWFTSSGNFDGRVHTNGEFRFRQYPTFKDLATSVNAKAWFYNNSNELELSANANGTIDKPVFQGGFNRGVAKIDLPTNSYSQQRAALGGNAADTNPVSNTELRSSLGLLPSSSAPPNGVYVVNTLGVMKGGLYVQGAANSMDLSVVSGKQVYTITDANAKVTKVTVDPVLKTTTVVPPTGLPMVYVGVPRGITYCSGSVKALRGPARSGSTVPPALASNQQMSVVATGDIIIQRDIMYENYNSQSVLGLFSSGGNVRIGTTAPNDLYLDGFVMASASGKVFCVDNHDSGSPRGSVSLRGGMVTSYYGPFGTFSSSGGPGTGYARNFMYDDRGIMPPYYPLTGSYTPNEPEPQVLAWRVE